jgi:RNA polymerase sigma factor FliA
VLMSSRAPDVAERNRLVIEHVGLVKAIASRLAQRLPATVEVSDLVGVGVVGLIEAAQRYEPQTGVPFDAFARQRLRGAMLDALRDLDWAPRSQRRSRRLYDDAVARLRHELGREPGDDQIAGAMGLSEEEFAKVRDDVRRLELGTIKQLTAPGPEGTTLLEMCIDPGEGPDVRVERAELRRHLGEALGELTTRERQLLALYYEEELTMAEIGKVLGVGESRVSQLRSLALSKLRTSLRERLVVPTDR